MQEIKKIGILSTAKIFALFGVVLGLVQVILMAIFSRVATAELAAMMGTAASFSWSSVITVPLFGLIVYFIAGAVGAALYNLFAKWIGGIAIEFGKGSNPKVI